MTRRSPGPSFAVALGESHADVTAQLRVMPHRAGGRMSKRINRGVVDTTYGGESYSSALNRLFFAIYEYAPEFWEEVRAHAPKISEHFFGPEPFPDLGTLPDLSDDAPCDADRDAVQPPAAVADGECVLDEILARWHLRPIWDASLRAVRVTEEIALLACDAVRSPKSSWPQLFSVAQSRRDRRLADLLPCAYERDQRDTYLAAIEAAWKGSSNRTAVNDQRTAAILDALKRPSDHVEHASLERFFDEVNTLTGVVPPKLWRWPCCVDTKHAYAPVQPTNFSESRTEFMERAARLWKMCADLATRLGSPRAPRDFEPAHYGWFVRYQMKLEPAHRIASSTPSPRDPTTPINPTAVRSGIRGVAEFLNLELREGGKGGRPRST